MKPKVRFIKYRLGKNESGCSLCGHGKKNDIVWYMELVGDRIHFHWRACNRCRFLIFKKAGGKLAENIKDIPKQEINNKGFITSKRFWELSPDRREALFKGESLKEYEGRIYKEMDKIRVKKYKRRKDEERNSRSNY